jgi:hypothetical protein
MLSDIVCGLPSFNRSVARVDNPFIITTERDRVTQHLSNKSGITYYRLRKDEQPPAGWEIFSAKEIHHATFGLVRHYRLAAQSEADASKIIEEDYQTTNSTCALVRSAKTGLPITPRIRRQHRRRE